MRFQSWSRKLQVQSTTKTHNFNQTTATNQPTMKSSLFSAFLLTSISSFTNGFGVSSSCALNLNKAKTNSISAMLYMSEPESESKSDSGRPDFEFSFEIPKKGISDVGTAEVKLPPILDNSEIVIVRYDLPFGLNAAPDEAHASGQVQVVVQADGKAGGEKVGDILRQTTYWRGKEPGIFDVSKNANNFDLVVQALVTNDLAVADEIVLVFERPL
uniref:Uncharacterized protein n=1 Tax=Chaetoceros debilis TaxID=122233 RepID=A0A7S3QGM8_9STRA